MHRYLFVVQHLNIIKENHLKSNKIKNKETIANMPAHRTLLKNIGAIRNPVGTNPNFQSLADVYFTEESLKYTTPDENNDGVIEESILIYDSGAEDVNRLLIFSNQRLINLVQSNISYQMDGTFSKAPKIYNNGSTNNGQFYTIQARINRKLVPIFYILMKIRTQQEYRRLLLKLVEMTGLNISNAMLDMELACLNALKSIFPRCTITLCYYHFQEAIYSWIKAHGMVNRYSNEDQFRKFLHMTACIAFIPQEDVLEAWNILENIAIEKFENDDDVANFLQYFEGSFIGRLRPDLTRSRPRYLIEYWNQYQNVVLLNPRTNNAIEGWHNSLNHLSSCDHPTLYKFLDMIKNDMDDSRTRIIQLNIGQDPAPRRKKYTDFDLLVYNIVSNYDNISKQEYLTNLSNAYRFM